MSVLEEWFTADIAGFISKYMFKFSKLKCNQKRLELWNFNWIMKKKQGTYYPLAEFTELQCGDAIGAWQYSAGQRS